MKMDVKTMLEGMFSDGPVGRVNPPEVIADPAPPVGALVEVEPEDRSGRIELDGVTWVLRPDRAGRLGWERGGLPPVDRWWADRAYDDLPVPPEGLVVGTVAKRS